MNSLSNKTFKRNTNLTLALTLTAMFGALAAVLMLFELPIVFTLPFIKLDFSDIPVVLGAYTLGPLYGCAIAFIKIALNFLLDGSTSVGVGEIANFFFSISYCIPAVVLYRLKRSKRGAVLSLILGTFTASITAVLLDWFLVFPFYLKVSTSLTMESILAMASSVNPLVKDPFTMMLFSIFPANLFKFTIESILAYFAYMPLRKLINSISVQMQKKRKNA